MDFPEGATTPWPTYTVPPAAHVVLVIERPLRLPETPTGLGPMPSLQTTSDSKPLETEIIFADLTA